MKYSVYKNSAMREQHPNAPPEHTMDAWMKYGIDLSRSALMKSKKQQPKALRTMVEVSNSKHFNEAAPNTLKAKRISWPRMNSRHNVKIIPFDAQKNVPTLTPHVRCQDLTPE